MKRILVIIALCSPLLMQAQSIEHILKSIEQNNKELKAQKHAADATKMENRTNNNLPDPTVSYSSFYSNGAEGSLPLFQNRKKVKIAKAQAISAQLMQESAKDRVEASLMSLFNEMQQLKDAMNAYDVPLMYRSLDLLKQALTEGQISLIEYFVETESIYKNLQAYMQIENQYQKVMANIYKNNL